MYRKENKKKERIKKKKRLLPAPGPNPSSRPTSPCSLSPRAALSPRTPTGGVTEPVADLPTRSVASHLRVDPACHPLTKSIRAAPWDCQWDPMTRPVFSAGRSERTARIARSLDRPPPTIGLGPGIRPHGTRLPPCRIWSALSPRFW